MNLEVFIQNPWIGVAGTVFGIIGILLTIIFYLRTRRIKKPAQFKTSLRWYDESRVPHSELQLMFRGRVVPRFTITQLGFWNAGNDTIKGTDFASASLLRVQIPGEI